MSHGAITHGGHDAGIYHSSHAFEGGGENVTIVDWHPDRYNGKIIIQSDSKLKLYDADGDGHITDLIDPYVNTSLICANNNAEKFHLVNAQTHTGYIYNYSGSLVATYNPTSSPQSYTTKNGTTGYFDPYAISENNFPIGNYEVQYNSGTGIFNYNGDSLCYNLKCFYSQFNSGAISAGHRFQRIRKKRSISGSLSTLGVDYENVTNSSLLSGDYKLIYVGANTYNPYSTKYAIYKPILSTSGTSYYQRVMDMTTFTDVFTSNATTASAQCFKWKSNSTYILYSTYSIVTGASKVYKVLHTDTNANPGANGQYLYDGIATQDRMKVGSDYRFFIVLRNVVGVRSLVGVGDHDGNFYALSNFTGDGYGTIQWNFISGWHCDSSNIWIRYKSDTADNIYKVNFINDTLEAEVL